MRPAFLLALTLFASPSAADEVARPVALAGGHVWTGDGREIEDGVVVFDEGLVVAVGPRAEVTIPPGTRVVELAGAWIYPGFVDAFGHVGLEAVESPEALVAARAGRPVDPLEDPPVEMPDPPSAGLFPDRSAAALLAPAADAGAAHRKAGIGLVATCPKDGFLPGTTAVLALSGRPRREAVVAVDGALVANPSHREKGYPSTTMGVMAHLRQALLDARRHRDLHDRHRRAGGARPPWDPSLEALGPVLDGRRRIWIQASTETEIGRALDLAAEFGLSLAIVGGLESHAVAGRLAAAGVPVVLRLDWPDDPEMAKPKKDESRVEVGAEGTPPGELPPRVREERRRIWEDRARSAIELARAGVPFTFTTAGLARPSELHERIATLVRWGLPRAEAEAALTGRAASLLGVASAFGTIEPGRSATFAVLAGRVGDEKVKVKRLYVDGVEFDFEADEEDFDAPPAEGVDLGGTWQVQAKTEEGGFEAVLELTMAKDGTLSGTLRSPMGEAKVADGKVSGRRVRVRVEYTFGDRRIEVELTGRLGEDGRLEGSAEVGPDANQVTWTATRPQEEHR